jgi:hypothetical protein
MRQCPRYPVYYVAYNNQTIRATAMITHPPRAELQVSAKGGVAKSTDVLTERAMINWPELLHDAEDWPTPFGPESPPLP